MPARSGRPPPRPAMPPPASDAARSSRHSTVRVMRYRTLGRTGLSVSPLCLGNMMLGSWGNPDHDDAIRIIHGALDAGINFIDTADVYSAGESEVSTGKALAGSRRDDVILATKCHFQVEAGGAPSSRTGAPPPNVSGSSWRYIIQACEASLR